MYSQKVPLDTEQVSIGPHGLGQMRDGCRLFGDPLALFLASIYTAAHQEREGFQHAAEAVRGRLDREILSELQKETGGAQGTISVALFFQICWSHPSHFAYVTNKHRRE